MSYNIESTPVFERQLKRLLKKYTSLKGEVQELANILSENPKTGIEIASNCFKIRLAIKSKGKGKSGGARVITCFKIEQSTVHLLAIYDKSEKADLDDNELGYLLSLI